ncbi:MAG: AMP-binding protein [Comamonadaceae bacterium]|nr:AMP-binding protein [Comamonadaceae bacterium]
MQQPILCSPDSNVKEIPIEYPVDNCRIYILDNELNRVAPGEKRGRSLCAGAGVAMGYLNREELTQERFLADHIEGSGMMYRTGDIGVEITPGIFDFIGRKDYQVKIRGYRMEMGEIEYALNSLPNIKEV